MHPVDTWSEWEGGGLSMQPVDAGSSRVSAVAGVTSSAWSLVITCRDGPVESPGRL